MDDLWFYMHCARCMWLKKEYVKSALKGHLNNNSFTSLVNSLYLK
jgi:hypothetical protein